MVAVAVERLPSLCGGGRREEAAAETAAVVHVCRPKPVKIFFCLQLQYLFSGVSLHILRVGARVYSVLCMSKGRG